MRAGAGVERRTVRIQLPSAMPSEQKKSDHEREHHSLGEGRVSRVEREMVRVVEQVGGVEEAESSPKIGLRA